MSSITTTSTGATSALVLEDRLADSFSGHDFGALGNGTTDDYAALQAAIDAVHAAGGGRLRLRRGLTYRVVLNTSVTDKGLVIKDGVCLDCNNAQLLLETAGDCYGVRMLDRAGLINFRIKVDQQAAGGSQTIWQSAVSLGSAVDESGTPGSVSPFEVASGWYVINGVIESNVPGGVGIQMQGGISAGVIRQVEIADSTTLAGGVHADWGKVGAISASDIPGSKTNFLGGTGYTTHPHDIVVSDVRLGALSYTGGNGSHGVRLSGVHDFEVRNVTVASTTYAGVYITAGDLGYEFAPVDVKPYRHAGIRVVGVNVLDAGDGWGLFADCYADNVAAAVSGSGYVPLLAPIQDCDLRVEQFSTWADAGANVDDGMRLQRLIGARVTDCRVIGHKRGVLLEEGADEVIVDRAHVSGCREDGVFVGHGTDKPLWGTIRGVRTYGNGLGTAGDYAGIKLSGCERFLVERCWIGRGTAETQKYGLDVDAGSLRHQIRGNFVEAVESGGIGYRMAASTDFEICWLFADNDHASLATPYAGMQVVPFAQGMSTDGRVVRFSLAERASLSGDVEPDPARSNEAGEVIFYQAPGSSTRGGSQCNTGGSGGAAVYHRFAES